MDLDHPTPTAIRVIVTVLNIYLSYIEIKQMYILRAEYLSDIWNYGNITTIMLNQFIMI
jgi:hypothetical protein